MPTVWTEEWRRLARVTRYAQPLGEAVVKHREDSIWIEQFGRYMIVNRVTGEILVAGIKTIEEVERHYGLKPTQLTLERERAAPRSGAVATNNAGRTRRKRTA